MTDQGNSYREPPVAMTASEIRSLEQLLAAASNDTGQSARVADFLLSWWSAADCGGWDPTAMWSLDQELADAILVVLGYIHRARRYPDSLGFGSEFVLLVRQWRPHAE